MSEYMRRRYHTRRQAAISFLGGVCVSCGTTEELEFDHIDPASKEADICKVWSASEAKFWAEVQKCQLLCSTHHKEKHAVKHHGTLSMYRYCKCGACRKAKSDYSKAYRNRRLMQGPRLLIE